MMKNNFMDDLLTCIDEKSKQVLFPENPDMLISILKILQQKDGLNLKSKRILKYCTENMDVQTAYVLLAGNIKTDTIIRLDGDKHFLFDPEYVPELYGALKKECLPSMTPFYCNDFAHSQWMGYTDKKIAGSIKNLLCIPLIQAKESTGMLSLFNKNGNFHEKDIKTALFFGQLISIAKNDDHLYRQVSELEEHLTRSARQLVSVFWDKSKQIAELKEQLAQVEKMAVLGKLAAGVANEFNNILSIIQGKVQMLLMDYEDGIQPSITDLIREINSMIRQTQRGAKIVHDMEAFSKSCIVKKNKIDVCELIHEIIESYKKNGLFKNIEFFKECHSHSLVLANKSQLTQVFQNIMMHASYSMENIENRSIHIKHKDINSKLTEIQIIDNGKIIDEESRKNIFIPKLISNSEYIYNNNTKNLNLALALAYSIIKNHEGSIIVNSTPEKGNCFSIKLPIAGKNLSRFHHENKESNLAHTYKQIMKNAKILVIDDEKDFTDLIRVVLDKKGFENADIVNSANEGLYLIKNNKYDIIFLDLILPKMNGEELFDEIRKHSPETRVIFISGKIDMHKDNLLKKGAYGILQKPFDINAFVGFVHQIN
jgi:signal transduction histidine kinase